MAMDGHIISFILVVRIVDVFFLVLLFFSLGVQGAVCVVSTFSSGNSALTVTAAQKK